MLNHARPISWLLVALTAILALSAARAEVEIKPVGRTHSAYVGEEFPSGAASSIATDAGSVDLGEQVVRGTPPLGSHPTLPQAAPGGRAKTLPAKPTPSMQKGTPPIAKQAAVQVSDHVEFRDRPVPITLLVGRERMVIFPGPVQIQIPGSVGGLLDVQVIGRIAYITALGPVEKARLAAQDLTIDQRWYPLDIVATDDGVAGGAIEIHTADVAAPVVNSAPEASADMVSLTRFAAHMLYAPRRLAPATPGVRQVPIAVAPVPGLYRGWRVQTTPIGAWRSGKLYVTAVKFTNLEPSPAVLDLNELRGHWIAATAQHHRLGPAGAETDTTAVYLICDRPFEACR